MRKYFVFSILSSLLFTGCQTLEQTFRFQQPEPPPREVSRPAPVIREPGGGPVTLYEAMARAIRTNLENEIGRMEKSLDRAETAPPAFQALAELAKSAGYGDPASDPGAGGGFESTLHPSGSGMADFKDRSTDVAAIWNALDFGLLHAVTGDEGRLISEKEGARQKAVRNILLETRVRYYRAAGAEVLTSEISRLLHQARETLRATRESQRQGMAPDREALETQRELIETIRFLSGWARALSNARIELTEWMGLNPGSDFELVAPAWNRPNMPSPDHPMATLERLALVHRWEAGGKNDIGLLRTREAMLRLKPDLDFDAEDRRGDPWISGRNWREFGLRLIPGLVSPSVPEASLNHPGGDSGYARRLTVNAAILTQVHLARERLVRAVEDYRLSYLLDDVNARLTGEGDGGPAIDRNGLSNIRRSRDLLLARMRHQLAFTELENAAFRFYNAVGTDPLPSSEDSLGVVTLARFLDRALNGWEYAMKKARADLPQESGAAFAEARTSERETSLRNTSPETTGQSPVPTSSSAEFPENGARVIDAVAAGRQGRSPVKEVEVYRDVVGIHHAPSNRSPVKGQGMIGETYPLAGWTPDGWLKIEMVDGSFGWIPTRYVKPVEASVSLESESGGQRNEEVSTPRLIATTARANVRSGPGFDHDIKYVEAEGTRLGVHETTGEWHRIRAKDGSEGWLHESVVKVLTGD